MNAGEPRTPTIGPEPHDTLLRRLAERVPGVIYQYRQFADGRSCFPYASDGIRAIYEVSPEDVLADAAVVFARLHPEDRAGVVESIRVSFESLAPWRHEYRVRLPQRGLRWLAGEAMPERLDDGSVLWHGYISDITDRRRTETQRRLMQFLVENAPQEVWLATADGRIAYVNGAAAASVGYPPDELAGMTIAEVDTVVGPRFVEHAAALRAAGRLPPSETVHRTRDGRLVPKEVSACWLAVGETELACIFAVESSSRKRAERALRASEALLSATFDQAAVGMSIQAIDPPHWLRVNQKLCDILGYTPAELMARTPFDVTDLADRAQTEANNRRLASGSVRTIQREKRYRRNDGSLVWANMAISVVHDDAGRPMHLVSVVEDITARRQAEQALREQREQLEHLVSQRTRALTLANRELESFVQSVAHDLRAPLRAIDGFAALLPGTLADDLPETARGHLARIRANAQRMGEIITDLLALARVLRADVRLEPLDLTGLAHTVAAELARTAPAREVEWRIAPGLEAKGDAGLVRLALENLLGNAWKYTARRPRALIELGETGRDAAMIEFHVRDNGAGFDMAHSAMLFEPFRRLHAPHDFEGTGVGLATVQRVIERHGGAVRAEGTVGAGATFWFSLPAADADR